MKQAIYIIIAVAIGFIWGVMYQPKELPKIEAWVPLSQDESEDLPPAPPFAENDPRGGYIFQWQKNKIGELWYRRLGKFDIDVEVSGLKETK